MERFAADCAPFLPEDAFLAVRRFLAGILLMAPDSFLREKFAAVEARRVLRTRLRHRSLIECANPRGHIPSSGAESVFHSARINKGAGPNYSREAIKQGVASTVFYFSPLLRITWKPSARSTRSRYSGPARHKWLSLKISEWILLSSATSHPKDSRAFAKKDEGESMKPWSALTVPPRRSASPRRHFFRAELP